MTPFRERLRRLPTWPVVLLALHHLLAAPLTADIAIVTGKSTPVEALDEAQVRALWLGTIERVAGTKLAVADHSDAAIRDEFYSRVLHKTRGQIKAIRAKRAFQHGIAPPPELPSDENVLRWVRTRKDRLGYVDAEQVDDSADGSVKVLLLIEIPERSEQP